MSLGQRISQSARIILTILGISTPYPDVNVKDIRILKEKGMVYTSFTAEKLINEDIHRLLVNHIDIAFIYEVKTYHNKKIIFQTNYSDRLSFSQGQYSLNYSPQPGLDQLQSRLGEKRFPVYVTNRTHPSLGLITTIDIYFRAVQHPEVEALWGNEPRINLKYNSDTK